jgi:cyclopropane-fatty-acyl-phospholipid synthase
VNRTRVEPLGVPESGGFEAESHDSPRASVTSQAPTAFDRWLVDKISAKLAATPVRVVLWDQPVAEAARNGRHVTVRIADRGALWQLLLNPDLHFGDLYSAGRLEVHGDLLTLLAEAYRYAAPKSAVGRWVARGRRIAPDLSESRRNIHHHYDIGNEFYELWLDREARQYTCAYYPDQAMTIEQAQQAKMHHVCRKLQLGPGQTVIEAGSGWGGFALFMAKNYGARVRSFNISKEQIAHARAWAEREGVSNLVEFVEDD